MRMPRARGIHESKSASARISPREKSLLSWGPVSAVHSYLPRKFARAMIYDFRRSIGRASETSNEIKR
jgi:hypothetical protein